MSERVSFPQVCGLSLLSSPNFTPEENNAGARGVRMRAWYRSEHRLWLSHHQSEFQTTADPLPTTSILTPFRCPAGSGWSILCPPLTLMWSCSMEQVELERMLDLSWGTCQGSHRKPAGVLGSFNMLPPPCFGSKQTCMHSSQAKSRMLTAPLSVPLVFRSAKGTHPSLLREDL